MSGPFYLKCLGTPELYGPDGRPVRLRGQKQLALLVFLVAERRATYRREELTDLLWSDHALREARHSLATALSGLRRVLGREILGGSRDQIQLDQRAMLLDVERLEVGDLFANGTLPALEVDGFLAGTDWKGTIEYQHWRDRQQARWVPHIKQGLLTLIDHSRRTGASRRIGRLADQLMLLDPLAEEGTRAKMEALAFAGDRINALRAFEEWRERLREELHAEPPAYLEEMARRLRRRGVERPVADPTPSVPADSWRNRQFVGRAVEHRLLYEAWERVRAGEPRHYLVEGESGIGKSTLVERFAMAAALEGAIVARTQCYELERELPFAMVAGLVTALMDKPGVASTDPAALAEVARVVRKLRDRFPGLPEPRDSSGETARLHFAEGVMAMLEAAMEEHPVILVADDYHLSDEASLMVLHLLLRRIEQGPLMVLLTMRSRELPEKSGAARIYAGGERLRMGTLRMPPLSEAEAVELLASLLPEGKTAPTPAERHALLQAARGVPMVLQLLVQDWRQHAGASVAFEYRSMTSATGGWEGGDSEGIYRHLVDRVLSDLDPMTRLVLHVASVLGSRVNDLAMYEVADLTRAQAMMGVAALVQRHVLRDTQDGLDFVNELVRGQAYWSMPTTLRRGLHAGAAALLLARLESGEEMVPGLEIAWHLVRGGSPAEAAPHLLRGANEAIRAGAPHEAELALKTAIAENSILKGEDLSEAKLLHAEILQELSEWPRSLSVLDTLDPSVDRSRRERADILRSVAEQRLRTVDLARHFESAANLIALVDTGATLAIRAKAASTAAMHIQELQDQGLKRRLWGSIRRLDTAFGTPEEEIDYHRARATLLYDSRNVDEAITEISKAHEVARAAQIMSTRYVELLNGLAALNCSIGKYRVGMEYAEEAFRSATRLDNTYLAVKASGNVCLCLFRTGRYPEQISWAESYLKLLGTTGHGNDYMRGALYLCIAMAAQHDRRAYDRYQSILSISPPIENPWGSQAEALNRADVLHMLGQRHRATAAAKGGIAGPNGVLHAKGWAGRFARWVAIFATKHSEQTTGLQKISPLWDDFDRHDAIDKVEIACAYLQLAGGTDAADWKKLESAAEILTQLDAIVLDQMLRLGVPEKILGRLMALT